MLTFVEPRTHHTIEKHVNGIHEVVGSIPIGSTK